MLAILLHSSKTMRAGSRSEKIEQLPALQQEADELALYLKQLSVSQVQSSMKLSAAMAIKTHHLIAEWGQSPVRALPAIDAFLGDIYSGLQTQSFNEEARQYANQHLFILSGLYGILRALDEILPYRLEMGYRLPDEPYRNLYSYWGEKIAKQLPVGADIVNLSAVEYTKAVLPYLGKSRVISPKFMTINSKTGEPAFVVVHAKIARGAFAHWMIQHRIDTVDKLKDFTDLGYYFDHVLSTPDQPVFVCKKFKGLGLSVRLT